MAILNTTLIENTLTNRISQTTSTTSTDALLLTALSVNQISLNVKNSVASPAELPDIIDNNISNGFVVYIESINIHVVASNYQWLSLDGRLYRNDISNSAAWAWGIGSNGELGDGTVIDKSSPVSVIGGFTDWQQVSAGWTSNAAIRSDNTIWAWGGSRVGDGQSINRSSPVSVVGGFTDWCQVSVGNGFTAAVRKNGTLWAWGVNNLGQLGDNTVVNKSSPVSVVGGFTDWCQVSSSDVFAVALRTNGTLWSWGTGVCGRLGDGTITNKSSPVSVIGGFTDWCQVSAGRLHVLALKTNGTVWSWGGNNCGQLGDGTVVGKSSPISVVGGFNDWYQISAGYCHNAAIRTNGTLWSWGAGSLGRLGNGTITNKSSPVSVIGGFTDWCQVSASNSGAHSIAVRTNGTLWAWGFNFSGQLGTGTKECQSSPVSIVGGFTGWCQVSAGKCHSLAIRVS